MKKKLLLIAVILSAVLSASCNKQNEPKVQEPAENNKTVNDITKNEIPAPDTSFSITDSAGRTVSFKSHPERIIVLSPTEVETMYFLNSQDNIIAVSEFADFPEEAAVKDKISTGAETNLEQIIAYDPDCVIMAKMAQTPEQAEALKNAGIPVAVIESQTIGQAFDNIQLIGKIVNKEREAADKVAQLQAEIEEIKERTKDLESKNAYVEISPLQFGLYTAGRDTFINELLELAGVNNIFSDLEGWAQISEEQIIERNPEVILSTCEEYGIGDVAAEIASRSGWNNIEAVKNSEIYSMDGDLMTRPGPRLVEAAKEIYNFVYVSAE